MIQVTAGVIIRDNQVLVCQRAAGSLHAGKWEFPGGKLEPGESLSECLRRELEEELGIIAEIGMPLATSRHHYSGRDTVEITFFEVRDFEGAPINLMFGDMRWMAIQDLPALDFLEADREFVGQLARDEIVLNPV